MTEQKLNNDDASLSGASTQWLSQIEERISYLEKKFDVLKLFSNSYKKD